MIKLFAAITIFGIFILLGWMAGSHGHFVFRPHREEDWFAFGIPLLGIVELLISIKKKFNSRNKRQ